MKRTIWLLALAGCTAEAPPVQTSLHPQTADHAATRVLIPAGPVTLGYTPESFGNYTGPWKVNERPDRVVELEAFVIDQHEVTVRAWIEFLERVGGEMAWHPLQPVTKTEASGWAASGDPWDPITAVSWRQARAYCQWLGLDLPTEAQWERAAHGPGTEPRVYPWGDDNPTCDHANVKLSRSPCRNGPVRVGAHPAGASPEGLFDMVGNVAEWTLDSYTSAPGATPIDLVTVRGGSYLEATTRSRIHSRGPADPTARSVALGFRCAGPADAAHTGEAPPAAPAAWPDEVVAEGLYRGRQLLDFGEGALWVPTSDGRLLSVDPDSGAVAVLGEGLPTGGYTILDGTVYTHDTDTLYRVSAAGDAVEPLVDGRFSPANLTAAAGALYFTERNISGRRLMRWAPGDDEATQLALLEGQGATVVDSDGQLVVGVWRDTYRGEAAPDPGRATGYYRLVDDMLEPVVTTDLSPREIIADAGKLYAFAADGPGFVETVDLDASTRVRHGYAASAPRALRKVAGDLFWGGAPGLYRLALPDGRPEGLRLDISVADIAVRDTALLVLESVTGTLRRIAVEDLAE